MRNPNLDEQKYADVDRDYIAPGQIGDSGMGITLLNAVGEGTGPSQRVGRRVTMKTLQMIGAWGRNPNADADDIFPEHMVRCAILYDRQANGVYPSFEDIYQSQDTDGNITSTAWSLKNLNNSDRFIFIKEWEFFVPQLIPGDDEYYWDQTKAAASGDIWSGGSYGFGVAPNGPGLSNSTVLKIFLPINLETVYQGANADLGAIKTGALYFITFATSPAAGVAPLPQDPLPERLTMTWRLKYSDK